MKFSLQLKCIFIGLCFAILFGGCSTSRLNWDPNDYTVRSGDSLYSIAWRYELDPFELARWNNLSSPYIIRPGDRLHTKESDSRKPVEQAVAVVVQPKNTGNITVEKGDTLYSLARQHNLSASELARINRLKKPYVIHPGQELRLQGGQNVIATGTSAVTARPASAPRPAPPVIAVGDALLDKDIKVSWFWPIRGKLIGEFNQRKNDAKGIDIAGTEGRRVGAAAAGKVVYSGNGLISYGNLVIIKHSRTYLSAYAHNSKLLVDEGQMVKAGQSIAELGSTGTDSPRLHFEIRKNGKPVDPLKYLPSS